MQLRPQDLEIEANHARSAKGALYNLSDEEPPISQCILQPTNTNSFSSRRIERRTVIFPRKPRCAWLQLKLLTEFCINKWVLCINGALCISSKSKMEREGLGRERERVGGGKRKISHITGSVRKSMMPHN